MKAKVTSIRITPRKVGAIADLIRGKDINPALNTLRFSPAKRTAGVLSTLLKSAVANASQKQTIDVDKLYVKTLLVGAGPMLKRFRPRAKGSASPIMKRRSQISVLLEERTK
jgi:large subunit ribosomal protein L22